MAENDDSWFHRYSSWLKMTARGGIYERVYLKLDMMPIDVSKLLTTRNI
jgi:hypothetical protein